MRSDLVLLAFCSHTVLMQVFVEPLAKLELMPLRADVEVGHTLAAPLQAYFTHRETRQYTAFTDCSLLPLEISMEKRGVFVLAEGGMMGWLRNTRSHELCMICRTSSAINSEAVMGLNHLFYS